MMETKNKTDKEETKRRAAYALNLCTVSVSQIIDYEDENILEQEYETILNNLNLENMPKDEALLNTLKKILDSVTNFRIQKGDKAMLEKAYQQKMKNAIWSAMPNFGLIVAGGNPFTMAVSLASQVGIGYMNYRKAKAENELEKEQAEWLLQRAAIEELNGVRRELFDCAWRLSDKYGFQDKYRLTERQITQYNDILMVADDLRRYERLDAVKEYFEAYPPFWYHFGHAANMLAQQAYVEEEKELYEYYRKAAITHYDAFMKYDKYALLREDQITSACALEYIDLLDADKDRKKIKELLEKAKEMSGKACDVLQLCAIAYLKISDMPNAIEILKYLVNEQYNEVTNAQLLSYIYVNSLVKEDSNEYGVGYRKLAKKVPVELLFPISENGENLDVLHGRFVEMQQTLLIERYDYVIGVITERYATKFNQVVPLPELDKEYDETFFSNRFKYRKEREKAYRTMFENKKKRCDFVERLSFSNFAERYLDVLNELINTMEEVLPLNAMERVMKVNGFAENIKNQVQKHINDFDKLWENMHNTFDENSLKMLLALSFNELTKTFFDDINKFILGHAIKICEMSVFAMEETKLNDFCKKHGIKEYQITRKNKIQPYENQTDKKIYLRSSLLHGKDTGRNRLLSLRKTMEMCANGYGKDLLVSNAKSTCWGLLYDEAARPLRDYIFKKKKHLFSASAVKEKTFAVLVRPGQSLLYFTSVGILYEEEGVWHKNFEWSEYGEVEMRFDGLHIGKAVYKNKDVNLEKLFAMIQELSKLNEEFSNID